MGKLGIDFEERNKITEIKATMMLECLTEVKGTDLELSDNESLF